MMIPSWHSGGIMSADDVLVLGGPEAGKTHYAGQLLGRLRNDRQGILRIRAGGEDDLHQFEEVLSCLEEGRAAGHTSSQTWTGMKCILQLREGDDISIKWPDYAGERLSSIVDKRELAAEWKASISASGAWLLFIRLSTLRLRERPTYEAARQRFKGPSSGFHIILKALPGDDRVRYVEILQMLLFASGRSTSRPVPAPRLAVVCSCWDELDEQGTPEQALRDRLPLLYAFIRSTWADGSWSVWGLSSLGRALRQDSRDEEYVRNGPEKYGYVIPPGATEQDSDLTAPVAWLLQV